MAVYIVHYWTDTQPRRPGRCRTDHHVEKGEVFYARDGRAIVRSCIADVAVDDTYRRNARALRILNLEK